MATESNLGNVYTAGLGNVGSYQVAGTPYLSASLIEEEDKQFSFSYVSKRIIVENTGSNDIFVYFVANENESGVGISNFGLGVTMPSC